MKDLDRELTEVLKHLPGWKVDPAYRDHTWCSAIMDGAGRGIHFNAVRAKGRLYLSGRWPCQSGNQAFSPGQCPHITIARDRPPEKIAADIQRRFLPQYLADYAEQDERIRLSEANRNREAQVREELMDLIGDSNVDVDVGTGGEWVRLTIRGVSVAVAKAALQALNRASKSTRK